MGLNSKPGLQVEVESWTSRPFRFRIPPSGVKNEMSLTVSQPAGRRINIQRMFSPG